MFMPSADGTAMFATAGSNSVPGGGGIYPTSSGYMLPTDDGSSTWSTGQLASDADMPNIGPKMVGV